MRPVMVVLDDERIDRDPRLDDARKDAAVEAFALQRLVEPFHLPVVVGDRGLVLRAVIPFSRQIRSKSTSPGRGLVNRPVNCLPLSVRTSPGTP